MQEEAQTTNLKKTLSPLLLWGLGVGYVISGMYVGWNTGFLKGGTLGMGIATFFIIVMYAAFSFSYAELACAIPKAGGVFDYATRALGKDAGFVAGIAQSIEFVFAPPAIAFGIGAYFNQVFPSFSVLSIALTAYIIFTALNIYGVKAAATFELLITVLAVGGLILFAAYTLPHFQSGQFGRSAFPNGWGGAFAAVPFAVWIFLGIEGLANVAEESVNPQKDISLGFALAISTLIVLCVVTLVSAVGVSGWEAVVYKNAAGETSDSPLPMAMAHIVTNGGIVFDILIAVSLFGLIASFHGLILAAGRCTFEFGRVGYAPAFLGKVNSRFHTPANALLLNSGIGIIALLTGKTDEIITIAAFGALTLYITAMISLVVLRNNEPDLHRPFRVGFYPLPPLIALTIAIFCLVVMTYYYFKLALIYFALIALAYIVFKILKPLKKGDAIQ